MARRYGPAFLSLAWPFLLWVALVLATLWLTGDGYRESIPSPAVLVLIPALYASTAISLTYAWLANRSNAAPPTRRLATVLNLVPGLVFVFAVILELL